jgi:aromatic ring-opening dioxygenase LigB subunit
MTMAMTVAMTMPVTVESVREITEAAIDDVPARHDGASVQAARHLAQISVTAVASPDKAHRYSADGPASHHGQYDATRTLHVAALGQCGLDSFGVI